MRHLIAAIDLGTTKVVCAVGEKTPAGIKIIAHSQAPSKGVLRGEVINIQHVLDSMLPVVNEVENEYRKLYLILFNRLEDIKDAIEEEEYISFGENDN